MAQTSNNHICRALKLARELTILADEGEASCTDDGCIVLFSVVRDCAYKIRGRAERERDVHKLMGEWDNESNGIEQVSSQAG